MKHQNTSPYIMDSSDSIFMHILT